MLFEIEYQLCKAYPSLSPLDLDEKRFCDVIKLFANTKKLLEKNKQEEKEETKVVNGETLIKRPATNWY